MGILNDQFKNMTPAQKTYVLSMLINKIYKNPTDYGLNEDEVLRVGNKLDFSKLFENTEELKSIFTKAKETIVEGGLQEKLILENNKKIAEWVKRSENSWVKLTNDKVAEILAVKPKEEIISEPSLEELIKPKTVIEKQIHREIEDAKQRLQVLEGGKNQSGVRSMMGDASLGRETEDAFRNEIDSIYGKSGLLGIGKVAGVNTKEWGEMARLPAGKIVEYYTGDSAKSGLPADIAEKLSKSSRHEAFMEQAVGLMEQSNRAVKPFENENMEQFIRRLGGYVLRAHLQKVA
ncbi:MAG: hypothetical protein AAB837_02720 [Patescibacteria group bacterium]